MADTTQKEICQMFDRIAGTYDPVNRVLSWGQDLRWRNTLARALPREQPLRVLDIATGTADLLIAMCQARANIISAYGVDLSENMLAIAQQKVRDLGHEHRIKLQCADACALPFADQ